MMRPVGESTFSGRRCKCKNLVALLGGGTVLLFLSTSLSSAAAAEPVWNLPPSAVVLAGDNPAISLDLDTGTVPKNVSVEVQDSKGTVVDVAVANGAAASFNWNVPEMLTAGQYTLRFKGLTSEGNAPLESVSPKLTVQQKQQACATTEVYVPSDLKNYSAVVVRFHDAGGSNLITATNPPVSYDWKDMKHQFGAGVTSMKTELMGCTSNGTLIASIKSITRDPQSGSENFPIPSSTPVGFYRLRTNYTFAEDPNTVRSALSGVSVVDLKSGKCIVGGTPGGDNGDNKSAAGETRVAWLKISLQLMAPALLMGLLGRI